MIFEHSNYQSFLKALLNERRKLNASYSLRAMALNLGISASTLSDVINGNKNLSEVTALNISNKLKLTARQKKYFTTLVQFQNTSDLELKAVLLAKLRVLNPKLCDYYDITIDRFNLMAEWYHTAILEMTYLENIQMDAVSVSKYLQIPFEAAQNALELLLRLGLIESTGENRYQKVPGKFQTQSEIPNEALRQYHYQMLVKAQESLRNQTPQEKFVGSETIPLSSEDLPQANEIIENCFQQLLLLAEKSKNRDHVYHAGIQFFKLTPGKRK